VLCKLFNQELCLYERCKYYDIASNDCTFDGEVKVKRSKLLLEESKEEKVVRADMREGKEG